jgi:hypothetical protein
MSILEMIGQVANVLGAVTGAAQIARWCSSQLVFRGWLFKKI